MSKKKNKTTKKKNTSTSKKSVAETKEKVVQLQADLGEEQLVDPKESPVIDLEPNNSESFITPPINPMNVPGVMPIPDSGMKHNVKNFSNFSLDSNPPIHKNKKTIIFIIVVCLLGILLIYLLFFKEEKKKELPKNTNSNIPSSSNSNNQEEKGTINLNCVLEEEYAEGVTGESSITFIFREEELIKTIDEESVYFKEEGLKHYSAYETSLKETLESDEFQFDNTTFEMRTTKDRITAVYTVDLTADPFNPNNNLDELGYTYQEAKTDMEKDGYICKQQK